MLPSLNVPIAVNCTVAPSATDAFAGDTTSETSVADVTVKAALPLTPELVAVIVLDPGVLPVVTPELETVAAVEFDELQLAALVRSLLLLSLYLPVAVNACVSPDAMEVAAGVT